MSFGYENSPRTIVWDEDPEWTASIHTAHVAEGIEMTFFHLDVYYMSPSVLKSMLRAWREYRHTLPQRLFTMGDQDTDALDRLRERFGFRYLNDIPCTDGRIRRLYVHFGPTKEA